MMLVEMQDSFKVNKDDQPLLEPLSEDELQKMLRE